MYQNLSPLVGEEPIDAWLSQHPTREVDEPATKDFVEVKVAELHAEMRIGFADLRQEMAQPRADISADFAQTIDRLRTQLISVGGVLVAVFALLVGLS